MGLGWELVLVEKEVNCRKVLCIIANFQEAINTSFLLLIAFAASLYSY